MGKLDEVIELVDDTVPLIHASRGKPGTEPLVLNMKCQALERRGDLAAAEATCRQAVATLFPTIIAPISQSVWLSLADVLIAEKKLDDAKAALATAEHVCAGARPSCSDRRSAASLYARLGEYDAQRASLIAMLDMARAAHDE